MPLITLKDKGQITLPSDIRKKIHADTGDIFNVELIDGNIILTLQRLVSAKNEEKKKTAKGIDISKYMGSMKGTFGSVEDIDTYINNERKSWD